MLPALVLSAKYPFGWMNKCIETLLRTPADTGVFIYEGYFNKRLFVFRQG